MLKIHFLLSALLLTAFSSNAAEEFEKPFRVAIKNKPIALEAGYVYPTFADLNGDGLEDLILGGYAQSGRMSFFEAVQSDSMLEFKEGKYLEFSDRDGPLYVSGVK